MHVSLMERAKKVNDAFHKAYTMLNALSRVMAPNSVFEYVYFHSPFHGPSVWRPATMLAKPLMPACCNGRLLDDAGRHVDDDLTGELDA